MTTRQIRGSESLRVDSAASNHAVERASMSPSFSLASVPSVHPEPAYIAAAAAANVITSEILHEFEVDLQEGASVSQSSLQLVNTFLDRLLFNFLARAHAATLTTLRAAVTEVLGSRLAKQAIAGAEEELEEYLGGDLEELEGDRQIHDGPWDLDVTWKRARLRCMIYTRLGDMEEEREEEYLEQNNLQPSNPEDEILPEVAIFLTSVLEFIGEHVLMIAAQAAYRRHETQSKLEDASFQRVIVNEKDMNKNAMNPTLGRLWRTWRASIHSPQGSISRPAGVRRFRGFSVSSRSSFTNDSQLLEDPERVPTVVEVIADPDPATIPIPTTTYDVHEIEVPGYSIEYAQRQRKSLEKLRPESMFIQTQPYTYEEEDDDADSEEASFESDEALSQEKTPTAPYHPRPRAASLPAAEVPVFVIPHSSSESAFTTPPEEIPQHSAELKREAPPIIDMSGNSVAIIGDYAIPKSSSAPAGSYDTPMLNATSGPLTTGLSGQSFYHEEDIDPTDGALQFDRSEYEIGEHEHSNLPSRVSMVAPSRNLSAPFDYPIPVSPLVGATEQSPSGAVSPLESEFSRHEVSPLVSEGAEEDMPYLAKKRTNSAPRIQRSIDASSNPVVTATAVVAGTAALVTTAGYARSGSRERRQAERQVDIQEPPIPRANQGRQRSREGPTSQDYTKEENREAFVLPQDVNLDQAETGGARRWGPSGKPPSNPPLPPVRESFERPPVPPISPEHSSPTRQYPVSRKAVPKVLPVDGTLDRQTPKIQTNVDPITGQRMVISPASDTPASRGSASDIRSYIKQQTPPPPPLPAKNKGSRIGSLSNEGRESLPSRPESDGTKSAANFDRISRSSTGNSGSQKDFDQLINSGETLQLTLTSQSMRELEERGREPGQRSTPHSIRDRTASADQKRILQPSPSQPSPQSMNGLRSNPTKVAVEMPVATSFVVHAGPPVKRGPQLVAKDARMERTDTSDLKDFFRSTGPAGGLAPSPVLKGPIPRSPKGREASLIASSLSSRSGSIRSKSQLEPREAQVKKGDNDTALLAEFFRQGPPGARSGPAKSISEDFPQRYRDSPSNASTSNTARSVHSSVNSRVGLLDSTRAQQLAQAQQTNQWDKRSPQLQEEQMPARKQRRVRDPYAIDTDSEDEEEAGTPRGEESLLDFLRNAEPPSEQQATPPPIGYVKSGQKSMGDSVRSKFGSQRQKSLLSANTQRSVSNPVQSPISEYPQASNSYSGRGTTTRGYYDDFGGPPRMNGGSKISRKTARDERPESKSVRDLADFFRETGPPASSQSSLPATPSREESGGFSRMFSRKKRSVIA